MNSQDKVTLEKSLKVLKQGGKLISISGPPDPRFAREQELSWMIEQVLRVLSSSIRRKESETRQRELFFSVHAGKRRAIERDYLID